MRCFRDLPIGVADQTASVAIDPAAVARDGRTLTVALRRDALGELASLVAEGATIAGSVDSHVATGASDEPGLRVGATSVQVRAGTIDRTAATPSLTLGD